MWTLKDNIPDFSQVEEQIKINGGKPDASQCLHLSCPDCHGTGTKSTGAPCLHMISCPCIRCSPFTLSTARFS